MDDAPTNDKTQAPGLWVSVDPGDQHVGWAEWSGVHCLSACEYTPAAAMVRLEDLTGGEDEPGHDLGLVVFERYQLYGWLAAQQSGSEFKTSQLIGAIKYVCSFHVVPVVGQLASVGKETYKRTDWNPREWPSWGKGGHAKDAVAHGCSYLRRQGLVPRPLETTTE